MIPRHGQITIALLLVGACILGFYVLSEKRKAEEQQRTYENRRRVRGARNKQLQKLRSELTERSCMKPGA